MRPFTGIIDEIANHLLEILAFARESHRLPRRERKLNRPLAHRFFRMCGPRPSAAGATSVTPPSRPRPDRDPGPVQVIGHLIAHDRRLLLNLAASGLGSTAASLMITLSGVFRACARLPTWVRARSTTSRLAPISRLSSLASGARSCGKIAFDFLGFAAPDRGDAFLQLPKRLQAIAKLGRRRDDKRERKNRKGHDEVEFEARDLRIDFFGRRRNLNEINALIARVDDAFGHAQNPVVRSFCIAPAGTAGTGGHAGIGQARKLGREQRARTPDLGLGRVQSRDLPIPARQGQFELRFAELARRGCVSLLRALRYRR